MWLDWLIFKILTVGSWIISLWSLILAYSWRADAQRERGLLNALYFKYERIRLVSCTLIRPGCYSLQLEYQLFPALACEQRTVTLLASGNNYRLEPAAGASPRFCVSEMVGKRSTKKSFTYWADPITNERGAACPEPFTVVVETSSKLDKEEELRFESTGSYLQRCILHTVPVVF